MEKQERPRGGWGREGRHSLAHPMARSHQLIVPSDRLCGTKLGQAEGWRRQRQLHELGGAGARAVTHEGSRSFVIGSLGLMQTGARV